MKTNKDLIIEPNAAIEGRKYSEEKPWSCKYCYWWGGKKKGCSLKQCHYLLPEKKKAVKTTPCGGCPYGKHVPCIGYCIARLYSEMKGKKGRGSLQEEVNQKVISLSIQGVKITASVLKAALRKFLEMDNRRKQKATQVKMAEKTGRAQEKGREQARKKIEKKKPHGKQTIKQLNAQGVQLSNLKITDENIKSFDRVARKYGIDYSLKKEVGADPPKYLVFFKAKDVDVMTAAFREYAGVELKKKQVKKPSVRKKLQKSVERKAKHRQRVKQRQKSRGQER